MKFKVLLFLSFIICQGCTSIAQPQASLNLVGEQFDKPIAPVNLTLGNALSNLETNATLLYSDKTAVIGDKFFAASGYTCRRLTYEQVGFDLFCKEQGGVWFKVNKVISEYNEDEMLGIDL